MASPALPDDPHGDQRAASRDSHLMMEQHLLFQLYPTELTGDDNAVFHSSCVAQAH